MRAGVNGEGQARGNRQQHEVQSRRTRVSKKEERTHERSGMEMEMYLVVTDAVRVKLHLSGHSN